MTPDDYERILEDQAGRCAICGGTESHGKGPNLQIDHDHNCCPGKVTCGCCIRGLLCGKCNKGIAFFNDDPELMLSAIRYLETNQTCSP